MKMNELREKQMNDLRRLLREKQNGLRELRFLLASGKVKNHRQFSVLRKTIAQIITEMRGREE